MVFALKNIKELRLYVLVEDYSGYGSKFLGQHGISILAETTNRKKTYRVLFDTGTSGSPVLTNAELLKESLKNIDYIVISHNHYDHTGGLVDILKAAGRTIPVIAHPEIFKVSFAVDPSLRYIGPPPDPETFKEAVKNAGGLWILSRDPLKIFDGAYTTGEIKEEEKIGFEKEVTIKAYKLLNGVLTPDSVNDEIGLTFVTDEGLVVLGGCSHPGIISIVKKAIKVTGINEVRAVVGGFHLINASEERIENTVKAFKELGVKEIYTGHCTGLDAESALKRAFGNRFHKLHAGMVIDI